MDYIDSLCRKYTSLTEEEIKTIEKISAVLPLIAELTDADMFVDCPCRDRDSIVVAEAKPTQVPSSYKNSVVGMLAKQENEPAVARTVRLGVTTKHMKAITQEDSCTIQSVTPIRENGRVIGVLIQEKRIDERRQLHQRALDAQESHMVISDSLARADPADNWLTECINEALLIVSKSGIITYRNSIAKELYLKLGYVDDVLGQPYDNVFLLGSPSTGEAVHSEVTVGQHTLDVKSIPLDAPGMSFVLIIRDITLLRNQEKAIILKSVAIKEMHHRVKNNLQTIASLLRLQMRRTESAETRLALEESMNRILSIASTHQLLAQSGVDTVMLGEVIRDIKNNVVRYYASHDFNIAVTVEGDDFMVDSDIAASVALIINELLQNSLKYAFPTSHSGTVRILVTHGELYSRIQVIDNGCGFSMDNLVENRLGLSIVKSLVEDKLFGTLELESDPGGTRCTFDFRNRIMTAADVT